MNEYSPKFGIVSFLAILGTKSIWEDNRAQDFLSKINKLYDEFEELKKLSELMSLLKNTSYKAGNTEFMPFKEIGTIPKLDLDISTFSDTIILALYGDSPIYSDSFFLYLTGFFLVPLFRRAFVQKIYLRGTLSIGKFFILKRNNGVLLVGPAVNDAAQSYECADWIGISASPNASLTLEQERSFGEVLKTNIDISASFMEWTINLKKLFSFMMDCYTRYDIPTKNGTERNGWALAWPIFFNGGNFYHTQNEIKQVFEEELSYQKYQQTSISNDAYRKLRNTRDFFNFSIQKKEIDYDSIQN